MFRDPVRSAPLVSDISDIGLRLKITRAGPFSGPEICASPTYGFRREILLQG
jgi:hypothetical protein